MLIEIHMIHNHSPANLNRDDLGAPKTCYFGGVLRSRISSQCLKRSIRRSSEFAKALEKDGGVRTRRLITILAEKAHGSSPAPDDLIELVSKAFEQGGVKKDPTKEDAHATNILMFVPISTLEMMARSVLEEYSRPKHDPRALCEKFAGLLGEKAAVPDIALCGRMTELDSEGLFRDIDFHVEAALSAAHAISTHETSNETDYFTAADDMAKGTGAAHVNEAMYSSACFYKYFCIHWDQLKDNVGGNVPLAELTLRQFLYAAALSTPPGKQKGYASFTLPDGILVGVKTERLVPVNYANAFADPVPPKSARGLTGESIARLGQHIHDVAAGYPIKSDLFWFSPNLRYRLTYIDRKAKESEQEKPVIPEEGCNLDSLDGLVAKVMDTVAPKLAKPDGDALP